MKGILQKNIPRGYVICLGIVTLFIFSAYYSYAMFTVKHEEKETIRIISGNLHSRLVNENAVATTYAQKYLASSKMKFTINPNEEKTVVLKIENINSRDAKYNLFYDASRSENFKIGYLESTKVIPNKEGFVIKQGENQEFYIRMHNLGTDKVTVTFNSEVGLADKPLDFPQGKEVLTPYEIVDKEAVTTLLTKANTTSNYYEGKTGELYPIELSSTKQENTREYRYIGENPNNYMKIQEDFYRIVGIFEVKDEYGALEKRIKVVKETPIKSTSYQLGEDINYQNSQVNEVMNEYYGTLNDEYKALLTNVEWYLGDLKDLDFKNLYQKERSNSKDKKDLVTYLAPLYASDYQYSYALGFNDACFNSNQNCRGSYLDKMMGQATSWFLSYNSNEISKVTTALIDGTISFDSPLQVERQVYPSFYLNTNAKLTGDGTMDNPYQVTLE